MPLYSSWSGITLCDVPDEVSLSISISGCKLRCKGCHSPETYCPTYGEPLDLEVLLTKHTHITCVVFYGGEHNIKKLLDAIQLCKDKGLLVCLYTGYTLKMVPQELTDVLDWIKVGPYIKKLGGLDSPITNQKLIKLKE